jgi:hypothetical protein
MKQQDLSELRFISIEDRFHEGTLKKIARGWAERFPLIRKVNFFRSSPAREEQTGPCYAFLVRYDENDPEEVKRFKRWTRGRDDCRHVIDQLAGAYKRHARDVARKNEWIWYEDVYEEGFCPDTLLNTQSIVLYDRNEPESPALETSSRESVVWLAEHGRKFREGPKENRFDNLSKAMSKAWDAYREEKGSIPSARNVYDWLKVKGAVQEKEEADDRTPIAIHWKRTNGKEEKTTYHSFKNRYTLLKKKKLSKSKSSK